MAHVDPEARKRYGKAYRAKNKERIKEIGTRWRLSSKEHLNASRRKWYADNPESEFDYQLRRRYEITLVEYNALLASQGGCCAICAAPPKKRRLTVDHDHGTTDVRGLLCHRCNVGLGLFSDSPGMLLKAIAYLSKHAKTIGNVA